MVIFASPRFFERGRPRDLRGKAASMRMGESSKATVLQNELYTWICKTGFRVACLTSLLAFRSLGIRRHPRRFAPCQLDEGWSSPKTFVLLRNHAKAERRLLAYRFCSPRAGTKKPYALSQRRYRVRPQAGDLDILLGVAAEGPIPSPVREEFTIWDGW
jgi:hypothetical protein